MNAFQVIKLKNDGKSLVQEAWGGKKMLLLFTISVKNLTILHQILLVILEPEII